MSVITDIENQTSNISEFGIASVRKIGRCNAEDFIVCAGSAFLSPVSQRAISCWVSSGSLAASWVHEYAVDYQSAPFTPVAKHRVSVDVGEDGTIHIVGWKSWTDGSNYIEFTRWYKPFGGAWTEERLSGETMVWDGGNSPGEYNQVIVDASGTIHALTRGKHVTADSTAEQILYYRNSGSGWSSEVVYSVAVDAGLTDFDDTHFHLDVDAAGVVHVVFRTKTTTNTNATVYNLGYRRRSAGDAGTWDAVSFLTDQATEVKYPVVAVTKDSSVRVIAYTEGYDYNKSIAYSGGSWGSAQTALNITGALYDMSISFDDAGLLHFLAVSYESAYGYNGVAYYNTWNGSWGTAAVVHVESGYDMYGWTLYQNGGKPISSGWVAVTHAWSGGVNYHKSVRSDELIWLLYPVGGPDAVGAYHLKPFITLKYEGSEIDPFTCDVEMFPNQFSGSQIVREIEIVNNSGFTLKSAIKVTATCSLGTIAVACGPDPQSLYHDFDTVTFIPEMADSDTEKLWVKWTAPDPREAGTVSIQLQFEEAR